MRLRAGWRAAWVGIALCALCGSGWGQATQAIAAPAAPPKEEAPTDRKVPLLARELRLTDFDGMAPKADVKGQLTEISGFIQNSPADGKAATQRTVAWIGYTPTTLYVVFACYDTDPKLIRGHLARRENILNDDTVSVLLDPFKDRRRGILI